MSERETPLLKLGGTAGILAGTSLILSFVLSAIVILGAPPPETVGPEWTLPRILQIRTLASLVTAFVVIASALAILLFLALNEWLKGTSFLAAWAAVLGTIAVAVHAVGAIQADTGQARIAELYVAATAEEKVVLATLTKSVSAEALYTVAPSAFLAMAFLAFAGAMLQGGAILKRYGWLSLVLGLALVAVFLPGEPGTDPHLLELFLIIWSIPVGLRTYRLSGELSAETPVGRQAPADATPMPGA